MAQIRMMQRRNELSVQEDRLQQLEAAREGYEREFKEKTMGGTTLSELALYLEFRDQSHVQRLTLEEGREKILTEIEKERGRLVVLTQDRKILEKLKGYQQEAYQKEQAKKERKHLEDLVVHRHSGGMMEQ